MLAVCIHLCTGAEIRGKTKLTVSRGTSNSPHGDSNFWAAVDKKKLDVLI